MPNGNPTSLSARTQFRLRRGWRRILQKVQPVRPPEPLITAQTIAAPGEIGDPKTFTVTDYGSGAFGHWILDEAGLPAYRYEMDQFTDERAAYPVSEGAFRRDHWHQVGNERLNALASNDGTVQVLIGDRGGMFLNRFDLGDRISVGGAAWEIAVALIMAAPRALKNLIYPGQEPGLMERIKAAMKAPGSHNRYNQHAYAGGFGYIADGQSVWSTAYRYSPALRPNMERVFGMGYYQTVTTNHDLRVRRRVYAPAGDVSVLLADVELTNTSAQPIHLSYYEYWDVNVQQLPFQLLRSGVFGAAGDAERQNINARFTSCIVWESESNALRFHQQPPAGVPAVDNADAINWAPPDIFLADLSGTPTDHYTDTASFFGAGGAEQPDAITKLGSPASSPTADTHMLYCMVLRRDLTIEAGASARLRFAYGTVEPQPCDGSLPASWQQTIRQAYWLDERQIDPFADLASYWQKHLAYFRIADAPHVQREMAWHAYYLQSSTIYHEYFGTHIVPQGSAYLYLHGLDGVPRDFSLFVVPLIYLNPDLAREMLKLIMVMTAGDTGQIAYSYTGNGVLTGAIVHEKPSDLDLFFLLAVGEYLAATGYNQFLTETTPFYPGITQPADRTVLNHIRIAFNHLIHEVNLGSSDLLRVMDGDWSDDVILRNVFPSAPLTSPGLSIKHGESVPNSQMALYVLPRIAEVLGGLALPEAVALSQQMRADLQAFLDRLKRGVQAQWNGQFYHRATLRYWWNGTRILHANKFDLEAQVWALIGDFEPQPGKLDQLRDTIYHTSDEPSPIGALMTDGSIWPAIAQLLTWGYVRRYPDLAWRSFINQTFATKAEVLGDTWLNIWSGPDGLKGVTTSEPGQTYNSAPATPMTDFPVMNNNQHAMALLALLRVCGIEPAADGLRIAPQKPDHYALDLPLLRLEVRPELIRGEYRAQNAGTRTLYLRLPARPAAVQATINGADYPISIDSEGYASLSLPAFKAGDVIAFEVNAAP